MVVSLGQLFTFMVDFLYVCEFEGMLGSSYNHAGVRKDEDGSLEPQNRCSIQ